MRELIDWLISQTHTWLNAGEGVQLRDTSWVFLKAVRLIKETNLIHNDNNDNKNGIINGHDLGIMIRVTKTMITITKPTISTATTTF